MAYDIIYTQGRTPQRLYINNFCYSRAVAACLGLGGLIPYVGIVL